ncbi:KfrB domain-containing protein [Xanthomonas hortorum]|uniref:KfrB domain-containing protein n=1 Tax=Xanthomonas hortorum TaxID=56454 RepID=UPI0032E8F3CB
MSSTDTGSDADYAAAKVLASNSKKVITDQIREFVAEKLGRDAVVFEPRDDSKSGYKGPVIHADSEVIVQAVGKGHKTAIVHKRSDVEMQGPILQSRDHNNDLVNRNIQVHYRLGEGKAYQWNPERDAQNRAERAAPAERKLDPVEAAKAYAETAFRTAKQRDAFVAHVQNVQALATGRPQERPQETTARSHSKPASAKGQEQAQSSGLER